MISLKSVSKLLSSSIRSNLFKIQNASFANEQIYEKCINQVVLLGRVGTEPTVRGSDGNPLIAFSLATNTLIKNTDDIRQKTDWHKIAVFRPHLRDSLASYLRKGQRVLVQGKISYNQYQDANGIQRQSTTIIADDVIFMGSAGSKENVEESTAEEQAQ